MTDYQKEIMEEKTLEEYEAAHTNYFGGQYQDEDSLEKSLQEHFQNV